MERSAGSGVADVCRVRPGLTGRAGYRRVEDAPGFSLLRESEATYEAHFRAETTSLSALDGLDFHES